MSGEKKVLNFTTIKLIRDRQKVCQCEDVSFKVDIENRVVTCAKCGAYYDPFDALVCIAEKPEKMAREMGEFIQARSRAIMKWKATHRRKPRRLLFQKLERESFQSRGHRMLPACPHCGKPFYFERLDTWLSEEHHGRVAQVSGQGGMK